MQGAVGKFISATHIGIASKPSFGALGAAGSFPIPSIAVASFPCLSIILVKSNYIVCSFLFFFSFFSLSFSFLFCLFFSSLALALLSLLFPFFFSTYFYQKSFLLIIPKKSSCRIKSPPFLSYF